ncbi:MAG: hypothetical protein WD989_01350 [Candidatus Paceibacterota bacterium]
MIINKVITGIISLAVVALVIVVGRNYINSSSNELSTKNENGEYVVELRDDGFFPENLKINGKETVRFINKSKNQFWPASDFHPVHTIYPEFDPKNPVEPGQSWSFRFEKIGKWRYHDHLAPYFTGTIEVVGTEAAGLDCANLPSDATREMEDRCWNEVLFAALESGGVKGAMVKLQELYQTDPNFIKDGCHRWAHIVGDMAFERYGYRSNKIEKWEFPAESIYCGYGFFHGIFEHFFREKPDLTLARRLCERLDETLSDVIPMIRKNCFHGIGHGFMPEPPAKKIWGDPKAMMEVSLKTCEEASPTDDHSENVECMEGSFNVMADWMQQNKYGLSVNKEDPLGFCRKQDDRDRTLACFYEYAMRITNYADDDLVKIANIYIKDIDDDEIAEIIINSASASLLERHLENDNFDHFIRQCHQIPQRLQDNCISGLNGGLLAHGEPGKEYIKALNLCASQELKEAEKDGCFKNVLMKIGWRYQKERISKEICPIVPERFQHYCPNES